MQKDTLVCKNDALEFKNDSLLAKVASYERAKNETAWARDYAALDVIPEQTGRTEKENEDALLVPLERISALSIKVDQELSACQSNYDIARAQCDAQEQTISGLHGTIAGLLDTISGLQRTIDTSREQRTADQQIIFGLRQTISGLRGGGGSVQGRFNPPSQRRTS